MTCIVGIAHKGKVYIGGDSAGISGYNVTIRSDRKVFRNGGLVIGFTTSFRMGQLLRCTFQPPAQEEPDDMAYLVNRFVPAVRQVFKDSGFSRTKDGEDYGGSFLIGYKSRLYQMEEDFQIADPADQIASTGCGAEIALGALYALKTKPTERILTALEITARLNASVRPPFVIETL